LKYHPDKIRGGVTEADKEVWLTIVKAYETLLDKDKRRKFDSTLAFDDKIPQAGDWKTDAEFYTVFGDMFRRNSMWANKLPVPQLGDEKDSIEYAQNFYKYWDNFDSWRQFCQFDEHDTENCQDRW
jgi:DnaJ homolog subfamily C member 2